MSWKAEDGCGRKLVSLPRLGSREHKKNGTCVKENQRDSFSLKLILKLQYMPNPQLVNDWDGVGQGFDWDLQLSMFCSTIKSSVNRKQRVTLPTLFFFKVCLPWLNFTLRLKLLHLKRSKTFLLLIVLIFATEQKTVPPELCFVKSVYLWIST